MKDRELIADLLSALEYHTEQTRPIEFSKVAIQSAREYLQKPAHRTWVGLTDEEAMKLVPVEPTQKMLDAPPNAYPADALVTWKAMLAAAPQPAVQQEPVAYGMWDTMLGKDNCMMMVRLDKGQDGCTVPLYTSPSNQPGYQAMAMAVTRLQKRCLELEGKQPAQQEPVAWANPNDLQNFDMKVRTNGGPLHTVPFYTSPPAQRTWVGLTDEEAQKTFMEHNCTISADLAGILARAIEAKLKERNQ